MPDPTCPKCTLGPLNNSEHAPISCDPSVRIPYALIVLGSHLCIGCGKELCRVAAPPDPVYGLPICTCPDCGTSVVRRKHRLRLVPISFRRAISLAWLLPMHLLVATVVLMAIFFFGYVTQQRATGHGLNPIAYLALGFQNEDLKLLLSNAMLLTMVMMFPFLGGAWFGHHLTHWKKPWFLNALIIISIVLAGLPMLQSVWAIQPVVEFEKLLRTWPLRLEMTGLCAAVAMFGCVLAHPSAKLKSDRGREHFRKRLGRTRRRFEKRRTYHNA